MIPSKYNNKIFKILLKFQKFFLKYSSLIIGFMVMKRKIMMRILMIKMIIRIITLFLNCNYKINY